MQTVLVLFAFFFFGALAPGQTVGEMKQLEGGVFASQDGKFLYLLAPAGVEVRIGDVTLKGADDPHWEKISGGIQKIPLENFGLVGAGEVMVAVKQPNGEFINQKVENLAGKVTLLPGDITLVEGQQLRITTLIFGAPSEVRFAAGLKELKLGSEKRKGAMESGAVVTEYLEGFELPPGEWKVTFSARNAKGFFSDTIRVRVIPVQRLTICCPDILK